MIKRFFDVAVSIIVLLVFSPILVVTAVLVRLKLGSPILFRQVRPGQHGRPFEIMKFRTMTSARDSEGKLLPDEIRLTTFGKWLRKLSLDELPQLINVIRGDISLVGPRPLLMEYLSLYNSHQKRRHEVRPGITGWAQVNGRNLLSWEEKFDLDVWYVDHQSFWLDMKILMLTVFKVFRSEGITQNGHATVEPFKGTSR